MGLPRGAPLRRAGAQRQVQNFGRELGGGADSPRGRANDPDSPAVRLLGLSHGDSPADGAGA